MNSNLLLKCNIRELYDINLENKYLAIAGDKSSPESKTQRVCDGMVLYNVQHMKSNKIFEKIIDYVRKIEHKHHAYSGEIAVECVTRGNNLIYNFEQFSSVDYCDTEQFYISKNACVIKYSERNGYCPWTTPRWMYPKIAIKSYDDWHKYCNMTDYKLLERSLLKRISLCTSTFIIRAKRLFIIETKRLICRTMKCVLGFMLRYWPT